MLGLDAMVQEHSVYWPLVQVLITTIATLNIAEEKISNNSVVKELFINQLNLTRESEFITGRSSLDCLSNFPADSSHS